MNKPKLIKREEWDEQKLADQLRVRLAAAARAKVDTVRDWVERHQATPKPNSRILFAALFAKPKAS